MPYQNHRMTYLEASKIKRKSNKNRTKYNRNRKCSFIMLKPQIGE